MKGNAMSTAKIVKLVFAMVLAISFSHSNLFSQWSLTGNAATNPPTNYVGTTDSKDFVIKTNATERMRVLSGGKIGILTSSPGADFHVNGAIESKTLYVGTSPDTNYPVYFEGFSTKANFPLVYVVENTVGSGAGNASEGLFSLHQGGASSGALAIAVRGSISNPTTLGGKMYAGYWTIGADSSTNYGGYFSVTGNYGTNYGAYFGAGASASGTSYGIFVHGASSGTNRYSIYSDGTSISYLAGALGIGTTTVDTFKLAVCGSIHAKSEVLATGWCDYVFDKDYDLMSLAEVEKYINTQKHLPGIPTTKQVEENGLNVGDMQVKMMQKIEELTLYVIDLKKQNDALKVRLASIDR
jgi:hypothetical protein